MLREWFHSKEKVPNFYISYKDDFSRFSRCANFIYNCDNKFPNSHDLLNILEKLKINKAVLFPCSDPWLKAVVDLPQQLRTNFLSSIPNKRAVKILINKGEFGNFLKKLNVPHPLTYIIDNIEQLKIIKEKDIKKFFIKPRHSIEFQYHFHRKGFLVFNVKDAINKFQKIKKVGQQIIIQEYIPGPPEKKSLFR